MFANPLDSTTITAGTTTIRHRFERKARASDYAACTNTPPRQIWLMGTCLGRLAFGEVRPYPIRQFSKLEDVLRVSLTRWTEEDALKMVAMTNFLGIHYATRYPRSGFDGEADKKAGHVSDGLHTGRQESQRPLEESGGTSFNEDEAEDEAADVSYNMANTGWKPASAIDQVDVLRPVLRR
ncbi:uncharacterized protein MYCGRDRAFT_97679 [Zymoseptoria tritici IPO323]|uniref:Uncharacterized protein n=1 Tax=Zymoseptoria tritici (strain CBS 115943 / IPO323) TaxID=336722 RepID=F9XQZ3_ZYMTI|nr:uncharacterized protein MYCGRDRAFT_97679 [Zymoseptoria tritici IPO323]EGP82314.1 hypothetical protein MYCGRDRAFT_97679 [Zymoseptoria tritici IPO323]